MPFARNFFSKQEQALVEEAIRTAETKTSAEIVVHLDNLCFGNPIRSAEKVFVRLGMHKTAERNGVLIYIAALNKKIAVLGDEGIYSKLEPDYWKKMVEQLIAEFKANHKAEALSASIMDIGNRLAEFFPRQHNDTDELSNKISFT
ncbi:MAG: TPM domain-containing protein [Bacteroidia bacterium]|jgi:uncharacterized membrane protein|nr:TPM domain-containing protein [Bacteroidia bacterium]